MAFKLGFGFVPINPIKGGVPANAWRFANNTPVRRSEGGFWLKDS